MEERPYHAIGDVLCLLREEFPEITISKIRFLESRGLLVPERTPSGFRRFTDADVERLRWILRQQRENFLPLKVIKGRLEGDPSVEQETPAQLFETAARSHHGQRREPALVGAQRGGEGAAGSSGEPAAESAVTVAPLATIRALDVQVGQAVEMGVRSEAGHDEPERSAAEPVPATGRAGASRKAKAPPEPAVAAPESARESAPPKKPRQSRSKRAPTIDTGASLTGAELASASSVALEDIDELEAFGLVKGKMIGGVRCYDEDALVVARLAARFAKHGIEPRHLRIFIHAADRQGGLYEQVVTPLLRQRNPDSRAKALEALDELSSLGASLQKALVAAVLRDLTG